MPISRRLRNVCLLVVAGVALASCGTVKFYAQAAHGQWHMLHRARPIPQVIADPSIKAPVKAKLQVVQELRSYAKTELHLPVERQFSDYSDLGRRYAVWVVFAAPEFSVEAKTWWYPLVGKLKYRGFFDEASANAEAAKLKAQGLDVYVGGTEAYSTLGWFADPVLNTFLHRSDAELAELIFHELTHAKLFIVGDTDFNEALATAVGEAGVRRWLRSKGEAAKLAEYERNLAKDREIIHLLLNTRTELKQRYATSRDLTAAKAEVFRHLQQGYEAIKQRWSGDSRYDRFFAKPMNNARLNTVATYYDLVPAFERLLKQCDGDLDKFLARVEAMKSLGHDERRAALLSATALPAAL